MCRLALRSLSLFHPAQGAPRDMNPAYKLLSPADVPAMKELLRVFAEAFEDPMSYQAAVPRDAYLASLLGSDHFIALAAVLAEEVVGGLTAYVLDKFEQERREVYIYDLAVAGAHRRQGIATGLIDRLKSVARQRGAYVIFVQADRGDIPAIRLYESLGRREDTHNFDIPVDRDAARGEPE
jgi:aminoglycoside 3-N-acetyltransferase I